MLNVDLLKEGNHLFIICAVLLIHNRPLRCAIAPECLAKSWFCLDTRSTRITYASRPMADSHHVKLSISSENANN